MRRWDGGFTLTRCGQPPRSNYPSVGLAYQVSDVFGVGLSNAQAGEMDELINASGIMMEGYDWENFDKMNLFNTEGHYVIMREGDEYNRHKGAWEISALPRITARFTPLVDLTPRNNYRGFNSLHNFAGGVVCGGNRATAFIYEKTTTPCIPMILKFME